MQRRGGIIQLMTEKILSCVDHYWVTASNSGDFFSFHAYFITVWHISRKSVNPCSNCPYNPLVQTNRKHSSFDVAPIIAMGTCLFLERLYSETAAYIMDLRATLLIQCLAKELSSFISIFMVFSFVEVIILFVNNVPLFILYIYLHR